MFGQASRASEAEEESLPEVSDSQAKMRRTKPRLSQLSSNRTWYVVEPLSKCRRRFELLSPPPECVPATREAMDLYSVDYVRSLEHRLADMEGRPHHQMPTHGLQPLPVPPMVTPQNKPGDVQVNVAPSIDTTQPQQQIFQPPINELDPQPAFSQAFAEPDYISSTPLQGAADYTENAGNTLASGDIDFTFTLTPPRTVPRQPDDVPVSTSDAASYFFVYFEVIHSRYPFLRIQDCSSAYLDWKEHRQLPGSFQSTWHLFLVTMIFAIGTRIEQSHNSRARRAQRLSLVARIDSVQGIISDSQSSPLMRLQALLLYVVFAMLGDSTFGLVHVTGIAMRFATLHGFHRLRSSSEAENEEMSLKSRAWSCIYAIDRMISGTLRIPVCVADPEISSPLYEGQTLSLETMPWVADSPESDTQTELVDLTYFSHMIQFRHIQSKIIHGAPSLQPGQVQGFIEYIDHEIKEWSKENEASTRTYVSPLYSLEAYSL
ncbi:hypothetical protein LTS17_004309 [Exophiala oligosperma]